jgi:TRAP-type C4-dicarboxylate transport system substrate-binding protein
MRWASDHSGPPHPAGIAELYFAEQLEAKVPGSKVQIYWAKSLYNVPQGTEAMTEGNLEMMTGQFGKTSSLDPYMNLVVGPQLLTTPGAINALDSFDTYAMLTKRFSEVHDIKIFGSGHLSMYMGAGAVESRMLEPKDFAGKKIRSMGPAENALLKALGANPTTMAFGDVPPALQTGVIDGLLTSLGGFNATKDQAPYFTVAGINGIVGDYYWIGASGKWWRSLSDAQREVIEDTVVNDFIPYQKKVNFCNDRRLVEKYQVTDRSQPGIYVMNSDEANVIKSGAGDATANWIKGSTPDDANQWVDKFAAEAAAAVSANPLGSDPLEQTDCSQFTEVFGKFKKKLKKRL